MTQLVKVSKHKPQLVKVSKHKPQPVKVKKRNRFEDETLTHPFLLSLDSRQLIQLRGDLRRKYNVTLTLYQDLLEAQDGKCGICRIEVRLYVDHNHDTGEVRGLLCRNCNVGLGFFKDSAKRLESAASYLRRNVLY